MTSDDKTGKLTMKDIILKGSIIAVIVTIPSIVSFILAWIILGAFIDISETEFEAMHPRFTSVNMYRKLCERENIEFKRNKIVDNIGAILEKSYDDARTK